jgi:MoaA/NifB/PqqE/SkfB family radical SAM enzyme
MNNIVYAPWSAEVNHEAESELFNTRKFSILDIQLSGECNFNCCYCDSPDRDKPLNIQLDIIKGIVLTEKIKYVFICGLGEPTAIGQNYDALIKILNVCAEANAQCSIFTNLYRMTDELMEYIKNGILNVLFKLDSFEPAEVAKLYDISMSMAEIQLNNIQKLVKLTKNNNGNVNIGASIVPTRYNHNDILTTIKKCFRMGIYPLLTDLGYSGNATTDYNNLSLGIDELKKIKSEIGVLIGKEYNLPLCPSVISGIHINNRGKVTVDSRSGLSCGWFWAEEPMPFEIGDIYTESFKSISEKVLFYRKERFPQFAEAISVKASCNGQVFGGCGGNMTLLFERYKKLQHCDRE